MSGDRDREIAEIYKKALQLRPQQREAFLDRACADDTSLRAAVATRLAASATQTESGELAVSPVDALSSGGMHVTPAPSPGDIPDSIGPFKIIEPLGEGGMASVYLAQQTEPIQRHVALKVIKLGMDTRDVVSRFEAERQALAMMDHPHIAKVYEVGATADGRPYFSMEFIQGLPIATYCDEHRLSLTDRLRVFQQVCRGVQHAHERGVIHRDLKPSNILVTVADGDPLVKIIDFGVAKAVNQQLTERSIYTEIGRAIGTPAYMSSEQAVSTEEDIDARTDVYTLGVVLYELLVGELPLRLGVPLQGGV